MLTDTVSMYNTLVIEIFLELASNHVVSQNLINIQGDDLITSLRTYHGSVLEYLDGEFSQVYRTEIWCKAKHGFLDYESNWTLKSKLDLWGAGGEVSDLLLP